MNENGECGAFSGPSSQSTDKVVRSIPTYVSKLGQGKLYLIQHPLKPAVGSSKELLKFSEVKYKPNFEKFHFSVPIDPSSAFYDKDKGETLGAKVASLAGVDADDILEERPKFDHLTLEGTSVRNPVDTSKYVIAVVKKGQIHLCPLEATVQVKPTFEYLNKSESRKGGGDASADTETEDEEEVTKVTVKFSRNSRETSAKEDPLRPKTYAGYVRAEQEEPWTPLNYEEFTPSNFDLLQEGRSVTDVDFTPVDSKVYMDLLFPKYHEPAYEPSSEKKSSASKTPISQLKQMSLPDQVKTLMTNGVVLRYRQIQEFLRVKLKVVVDDAELIRTLQTAANVIQGNWVVRSDLVYPPNYVSSAHGISREFMQDARDFVLSKYTESRVIERKKMCNMTKLPVEEITEILQPIARKVPREGWEFRLPYDEEFESLYPDVIKRQNRIWERKSEQKIRNVSGTSERDRQFAAAATQRRRSRTKSFSSDTDSGAESESRGRRGGRQRRTSTRSEASLLAYAEP